MAVFGLWERLSGVKKPSALTFRLSCYVDCLALVFGSDSCTAYRRINLDESQLSPHTVAMCVDISFMLARCRSCCPLLI